MVNNRPYTQNNSTTRGINSKQRRKPTESRRRVSGKPHMLDGEQDKRMCRHIINAKVSIQTPCCKRWYECPECHDERENHPQLVKTTVAFACKTCRKIFSKDLSIYGPEDSTCPHCGTVFVLPAVTPEAKVAELALKILEDEVSDEISKF